MLKIGKTSLQGALCSYKSQMSILKKITDRYFYWKSWQTKQARQFSETLSNICNADLFQADWNSRKISENPKFSSFSISYIKWKHVHLDFLKPFEYYPPSKYMFKIVLNPLNVNPRNGQTHSNNSSATADEFLSVWPFCGVGD